MNTERSSRPAVAEFLIGIGVVLPLVALLWWYVSSEPGPAATGGPIVVAVVGAVMVLYGIILYTGRER